MEGLGVTLGLLGLISILVFLVRRLASLRNISYPGDYLVLLLLFGIFASGEILRLTSVNIDVFREYMHSLLLMHSNTCCILNGSWSAWFFPTHLLLVGLLLICLPFSSLIHMFSSFVTLYSRRM
jgi:nitrate reductase gamma subunit